MVEVSQAVADFVGVALSERAKLLEQLAFKLNGRLPFSPPAGEGARRADEGSRTRHNKLICLDF